LLRRIAGDAPLRVLDVGCGTGVLSELFADLGHNVTGIDLAPGMVAAAQRKATERGLPIDFRVENAAALSDANDTYDLLIARHVIWTLPDPAAGAAEWMRVLRPGGQLALIEGKWAENEAKPRYALTPRSLAVFVHDLLLSAASRIVGRKHWKLYAREYRHLQAQLPFSGGPPAQRLMAFLEERGFTGVTLEPLMNPALWEEMPRFPRYLVVARKPLSA
jgi:2-polyprenyl-3-methyl-5-hydroxy-6-metoxy-1,4-benzoquinol methylase